MKIYKIVLVSLIACLSLQAQQPADTSFMQRQYKQFKADLNLVKKCYITRSAGCTEHERTQARMAAARLVGEATALVAIIAGLSYGGYKAHGWWNKRNAVPVVQNQNQPNQPIAQQPQPAIGYQGKSDDEQFVIEQLRGKNIAVDENLVKEIVAKAETAAANGPSGGVDLNVAISASQKTIQDINNNLAKNESFYKGVDQISRIKAEELKIIKNKAALALLPTIQNRNKQEKIEAEKREKERSELRIAQEAERVKNLSDDAYARNMLEIGLRNKNVKDSDVKDILEFSKLEKKIIEDKLSYVYGNQVRINQEMNNYITSNRNTPNELQQEYDQFFMLGLKYKIAQELKNRRAQQK